MAAAKSCLTGICEEQLTCNICKEPFTRPKVLPCKHTFCEDCLLKSHDARPKVLFKCPECRAPINLQPDKGVAELSHNYWAEFNLIGMIQSRWLVIQRWLVPIGGEGQFPYPTGVAVSRDGKVFVADQDNKNIQVYRLDGRPWNFPTVVPDDGQKMSPEGVAIDRAGNLWVVGSKGSADYAVQYNKDGGVLKHFKLPRSSSIRGVAVDTKKDLVFFTHRNEKTEPAGQVMMLRPDGTRVVIAGEQEGMNYPCGITVDGEGRIIVTDNDSHTVFVFKENGEFDFKFGGEGSGEGQLQEPRGICTDRAGNIIVADWENGRVEMFDKEGTFVEHITIKIEGPQDVAMGTRGQLVVADSAKKEVTILLKHD